MDISKFVWITSSKVCYHVKFKIMMKQLLKLKVLITMTNLLKLIHD